MRTKRQAIVLVLLSPFDGILRATYGPGSEILPGAHGRLLDLYQYTQDNEERISTFISRRGDGSRGFEFVGSG
jgi:hypothetical protein